MENTTTEIEGFEDWTKFYKEYFGIIVDLFDLRVPTKVKGFDRLIVIPRGVTLNQVWEVCKKKHFKCWTSSDLEMAGVLSDRDPKDGTYAIWVIEAVEADEEMKNFSANDLKKNGTKGVTLLERLILELKYFSETGKHLDVLNLTLCSGSRGSGGDVPSVGWGGGGLEVGWAGLGSSGPGLRSRVAVTL